MRIKLPWLGVKDTPIVVRAADTRSRSEMASSTLA
jgi:hypothetical protein